MSEENKPDSQFVFTDGVVVVDITMLKDLTDGDLPSMKSIVDVFLAQTPGYLKEIQAHYEAKNWDALYKSAHLVKSSLSIIKTDNMFEMAVQIESEAKSGNPSDSIGTLIASLQEKFNRAQVLLLEKFQ